MTRRAVAVRAALPAAVLLAMAAASATAGGPTVETVLAEARAECLSMGEGTFTAPPASVTGTDLTGDGEPEAILDARLWECTPARSLWCGTGGCSLVVLAGGEEHRFLTKGWTVVGMGPHRVLLTQVHGTDCGGTNLRACFEAWVWSEGAFQGVGQP